MNQMSIKYFTTFRQKFNLVVREIENISCCKCNTFNIVRKVKLIKALAGIYPFTNGLNIYQLSLEVSRQFLTILNFKEKAVKN